MGRISKFLVFACVLVFASAVLATSEETFDLETYIKTLSETVNVKTPIKTDAITTLVSSVAVNEVITYRYVVEGDPAGPLTQGLVDDGWTPGAIAAFKSRKNILPYLFAGLRMVDTNRFCSNTVLKIILDRGMVTYHAYYQVDGKKITSHTIEASDCENVPTLDILAKKYFPDLYE